MIDLVFENQTEYGEWTENFFRPIIDKAITYVDLMTKQVEIGVQLVSTARIRELNLKYRNKDQPTDVLSFPLGDKTLEKYDILPLGDIFICPDIAITQASESGTQLKEEMARLAVHGVLHLLGYDHERSRKDDKKMLDIQEEILNELSFRN
jgi:probable rRNA maturation factor